MGKQKKQQGKDKANMGGDQIDISGTVSNEGTLIQGGRENVINIKTGPNLEELNVLFKSLYEHIESRPPDPNVDKEEIVETVQKIEEEASKAEEKVNEMKLERWMENLNKIAPDIIDVALASLGGPVSGVTAILKKIADRAHQQSEA